jgi:hypothetical protein
MNQNEKQTMDRLNVEGSIGLPVPKVNEPVQQAQALLSRPFLEGARCLARGVEVLAASCRGDICVAGGFLAAQSLETGLKAFLLHCGYSEGELIGHDIRKLWSKARQPGKGQQRGLSLEEPMPLWCEQLAACHQAPYAFRYPQPNVVLTLPALERARQELNAILDCTEKTVCPNATDSQDESHGQNAESSE